MKLLKCVFERTILIIVLISILMMFIATPASYAKLDLEEGDFYYSGTTHGTYSPKQNIFAWLLSSIGDIADWLIGAIMFMFRMVFVGWTALLEKLLTWTLESTGGVNTDGATVSDSNDLTSLSDSSNNVTVEAIVYNRVPALDINFFDLEYDRTVSGTGNKLICKGCNKPSEECLPGLVEENVPVDENGNLPECTCSETECRACQIYIAQMAAKKPLIIIIRELVATWYYIIRILAMAAMLLVLIVVGIKMATTTIASDKAVYKRMLVDWVVGVIILFAIHYFMIFTIYMNGVLIDVIEQSAKSINEVKMQQLTQNESELTNPEIEIKVYEEIRTRAYDAKPTNGTIGMVMYMTMVFFAFKYTIIYLKRYLTILVLTLMGPGVGVAYALQKALSGKSKALSTWMKEYIMNIIIQVVHALLYAVFISQALVLSLENVAGMVIALILMNYTSKADTLFKKIFKFGGKDSLLDHTEGAMDAAKQSAQNVKGLVMGAGPMAKMLTNTPYGKAVKGAGKAAVAAGVGVARLAKTAISSGSESRFERKVRAEMEKTGGYDIQTDANGNPTETLSDYASRMGAARAAAQAPGIRKKTKEENASLLVRGGDALRADLENATKALEAAKDKPDNNKEINEKRQAQIEALEKYQKFQQITMPSNGKILVGHVNRVIDMENVFENNTSKNPLVVAWKGAFGTTKFNAAEFKFENDGKGIYNQLSPTNFLGLTDKDKKDLKEMTGMVTKGLLGMGSIFFGMGSIVAEPKVGMALLAAGKLGTSQALGKDLKLSSKKGKYKFSRYGAHTLGTLRNSAIAQAQKERREMIKQGLEITHPKLAKKIKDGEVKPRTLRKIAKDSFKNIGNIESELGTSFGNANSPYSEFATLGMIAKYGGRKQARFFKNSKLSGKMDTFAKRYAKQQRKQIETFNNEAFDMQEKVLKAEQAFYEDEMKNEERKNILASMGYEYNEKTGELFRISNTSNNGEDRADPFAAVLLAAENDLEQARNNSSNAESSVKKYEVQVEELKEDTSKKITQTDVDLVDREIEQILTQISAGGNEIDINSQKIQNEIIKELSDRLEKAGLLEKNQNAAAIFKNGRNGIKKVLKRKVDKRNRAMQVVEKKLSETFTPAGATAVAAVVGQVTDEAEKSGKKPEDISINDVLSKLEKSKDGSIVAKRNDGSRGVSTRDGSTRVSTSEGSSKVNSADGSLSVGTPLVLDEKQKAALESYLQVTAPTMPKTTGKFERRVGEKETEKILKKVNKEAAEAFEKKRKEKLMDAITVMMGAEDVVGVSATSKANTTQDVLSELSSVEADYVTNTVKNLLELTQINKESLRASRDKVKGNKEYLKMISDESKQKIEIDNYKREQIMLSAENSQDSKQKINALDRKIQSGEENLRLLQKKKEFGGPRINVQDLIANGFDDWISTPITTVTSGGTGGFSDSATIIEEKIVEHKLIDTKPNNKKTNNTKTNNTKPKRK